MTNQPYHNIPRAAASFYGYLTFEGVEIPCAFGGTPGRFTAYILIDGICEGIGIDPAQEIARIQESNILASGLFLVPFMDVDAHGRRVPVDVPVIALSRLHTWLATIPASQAPTEAMQLKLLNMQLELADVVYGYFGRPLLPADMRAEEEGYLSESERNFFHTLEDASQLPGRVNDLESQLHDLNEKVERLTLRFSDLTEEGVISVDQQEQLRAMIDILARKYQEKHGPGTYREVESKLKATYDWRYYKSIRLETWPAIVRDCVQIYYSLFGRTAHLPRVFEIAQRELDQGKLF